MNRLLFCADNYSVKVNTIQYNYCLSVYISQRRLIICNIKLIISCYNIIELGLRRILLHSCIRPLSSVQNKLRFILHEPYDLSWPLSGRSLVKTCIIALCRSTFEKKNKSTMLSNLVFYLGWLICSHNHSTYIKMELDYIRNWNMRR